MTVKDPYTSYVTNIKKRLKKANRLEISSRYEKLDPSHISIKLFMRAGANDALKIATYEKHNSFFFLIRSSDVTM